MYVSSYGVVDEEESKSTSLGAVTKKRKMRTPQRIIPRRPSCVRLARLVRECESSERASLVWRCFTLSLALPSIATCVVDILIGQRNQEERLTIDG